MQKKSEKHSSQILNSCFYLFFVSYDKLLQKFDACDFIFSCKKKKGIYNSLTFKMYSAILNQHWLFNQDSFEWNIFFIADAVSLTVFSRAGAHKHSPEFPIPEMQILASA